MAKSNEAAQLEFIKDFIRNGEPPRKIRQVFVKKWPDLSDRTFNRRLRAAEIEYKAELDDIAKGTKDRLGEEIESRKLILLSKLERQDILSRIANGSLKAKRYAIGEDGVVPYDALPDHSDRITAIKELNKMEGDYAPIEKNITKKLTFTVKRK